MRGARGDDHAEAVCLDSTPDIAVWERLHAARVKRQLWLGVVLLLTVSLPWQQGGHRRLVFLWRLLNKASPDTLVLGASGAIVVVGLGLVITRAVCGANRWRGALYAGAGLGVIGLGAMRWGLTGIEERSAQMFGGLYAEGTLGLLALLGLALGCDLRMRHPAGRLGRWLIGVSACALLALVWLLHWLDQGRSPLEVLEASWTLLTSPLEVSAGLRLWGLLTLTMTPIAAVALLGLLPGAARHVGALRALLHVVSGWALLYIPLCYAVLAISALLSGGPIFYGVGYMAFLTWVLLIITRDGLSLWLEGWERRRQGGRDQAGEEGAPALG